MTRIQTTLAALVGALALTSCGGPVPTVDARPTTAAPETTTPAPTSRKPTPTPTPTGPTTNSRGNLVAQLGDEATISSAGGRKYVTWIIEDIDTDLQCTDDWEKYGDDPQNGHLIGVRLSLQTFDLTGDYFYVSSTDFSYVDPAGITRTSLDTTATYGCLEDSEEFPSGELSSGSKYVGTFVLDVSETTGTIVFNPSSANAESGWEVAF
jgi:hypothetical protein